MLTKLRLKRSGGDRAAVSHMFSDEDVWFPYRSALCGREVDAGKLTNERLDMVPLCVQCRKHLAGVAS